MDMSVEAHADEIDMYGDGSAVGSPVPRDAAAAASPGGAPGPASPAPSAGGVGGVASFAASVGSAVGAISRTALQALSGIPAHTQWVALADAGSKGGEGVVIMLTAGSEVRSALSGLPGADSMVPFECSKAARVTPVVLLEARTLFMELLPSVSDAVERGAPVTLTGKGPAGSLAAVVALMCAHQGLGANLRAVVFDAPPAVAEDSAGPPGESESEAELLETVFAGGLLADMGLAPGTVSSVFTREPPGAATRVAGRGGRVSLMRPLGRLLSMPITSNEANDG
eukprot:360951-Chlamydomonas_euryale.AAC.4